MALDIFNLISTGNLTADAVGTKFVEKNTAVINFTLAVNTTKSEVLFLDCNYWINLNNQTDNPETNLFQMCLDMLKKGKKITIQSNYATLKKTENEEKNTVFTNFNITVNKFSL
ncbi:hypothetical protein B0A67_24050 [Flavobacterium aquidurense]|uniref:single-stranded DNA-binding protein n=1 Tax=Flavobacterium aquidurense TaxID=362413 RepID=UPI000910F9B9|nr:single-stranded DNA-binding protein [Flavobacterium aquidurense]OXA65958.1 hypothetical protein B0A67_24050 [Flavobacterium aquidurense]SHH85030.1 Single-strand binding protein family protein [Flavobacterium frigidimaris]